MKRLLPSVLLCLAACAGAPPGAGDGWLDLLPGKDLKGWRRVPIKPLAAKPVWRVDGNGILVVDGVDAIEMLLHEREFGDGILHVEWRFRRNDDPTYVYNGGVYVRTALDGKSWVQAQVAHQDQRPVVGDLMGMVPGKEQRQDHFQTGPSPENPIGEWNAYQVECRGGTISLTVNGVKTATWEDCPLLRGHVGIQAEFAVVEVRAFRFKPL
jgi:hypothetical protein